MYGKALRARSILVFLPFVAFLGCATMERPEIGQLQSQLSQKDQEIETLKSAVEKREGALQEYQEKLEEQSRATTEAEKRAKAVEAPVQAPLLPAQATPGECYARVFIPPSYRTVTETLLEKEASSRIETIPAKYEWVEETVLVQEASTRFEEVPAEYELVEERVLVTPAHKVWKKGRGLIEKVDHATGEIMCLVEVPATYKTIKKQVMVKPATVREIPVPAKYEAVKVLKLVSPARTERIAIPAEYQTVTRTEQISDGRIAWRKVICETNFTEDRIAGVQAALSHAGYDPGPPDGVFGPQTKAAIQAYQREKGLAVGGLTYETIDSLGEAAKQ